MYALCMPSKKIIKQMHFRKTNALKQLANENLLHGKVLIRKYGIEKCI